ncbi:ECF-type sigma factor [Fuerstiella marisgermanici]|uniref:RNA polymerase sigma factor n=1 Tax=Fuerstiella marisgermanici TaxID=1891926 RepID=A0A1P8WM88_9PLAN|nr:ECF-type sigma factor [Fuerstiella marisgermanici]APZ95151.1 RNA polymerase sigma factor [Fuerstiella marisgermanici]
MSAVPPLPHPSADGLLSLLYSQLRQLAATRMAAEAGDHTLQPTALVHEVYLRLAKSNNTQSWDGAAHFYAAAAEAMRQILVESARRRCSLKRGGDRQRLEWNDARHAGLLKPDELLCLNESLDRLADEAPRKAELVKLRYFAGMSHQEAAKILNISRATADRDWAYAKVWLLADMTEEHRTTENSMT